VGGGRSPRLARSLGGMASVGNSSTLRRWAPIRGSHHRDVICQTQTLAAPEADATEKFVRDFVAAWNKVMNLDRFDLVA